MSRVRSQQTLTDFFAAKKSTRLPAKQALEKLRSLHTDLAEIKAKRSTRSEAEPKEESPAFERYADLLQPTLEDVGQKTRKLQEEKPVQATATKLGLKGKGASARLDAKRAALKAAREKLREVQETQTALKEVQATKKSQERVRDVPAYEKYHYLAVPSAKLPLPLNYQKLMDGFSACDTVVSMFHNRKELCRFDKLSSAVAKMTRHNFGVQELGRILTLKPDAYSVVVEKHRFVDSKERMHHIVSFVDKQLALEPKFLSQRKTEFKDKLLQRTAQYHQEYLDQEMPGSDLPVEAVKRWHPKFKLDSVPDIPVKELPKISSKVEVVNAKEVLENVRGKFSDRIEKALQFLADKQENEKSLNSPITPVVKETAVTGVSQSLLERIKKREALKMAEKMVIGGDDAEDGRQLAMISDLIRTIRQIFLSWPKAAIPYADLRAKLLDSGNYDDIDSLLARVSEIAPEWYKPLLVRSTKYVKIDKNRDVNPICSRVEGMIKKEHDTKSL